MRTCLGCGGRFKQWELARFTLGIDGKISLESGAKAHGRGAYSCRNNACLNAFFRSKKRLARAFRTEAVDGIAVDPLEIEKLLGNGSFR